MKKGGITPFCALSLMLVASLLFALLESARVYGLDRYATLKSDTAIDSVCAEFQPYLWQQYGLLFLDGAYGTETFSMSYVIETLETYMERNCNPREGFENWMGQDLFAIAGGEVLLEGYALATDDEGELFLNYVAEREKEALPLNVAKELYEEYLDTKTLTEEYGGAEEYVRQAQRTVDEVKSEWIARHEEPDAAENESGAVGWDFFELDGMLGGTRHIQNSGMLNAVFADVSGISVGRSNLQSGLVERKKESGTMYLKAEKDWYQKMLVLAYMEKYFANYRNPKAGHFLNYEMEYVLCGENNEWENLEGALEKIMLIREAANVLYLLRDEEKMALTESVASVIGLLAGENPAIVKVIQMGIVGAWAYLESVLDVRSLVSGDSIPLIKSEKEWTTDLTDLLTGIDKNVKARECAKGLNYTDYLVRLLFFSDNHKMAYRMMEAMEMGMQTQEEYGNCRMDHMLVMLRFKVQFESTPVFSSLVSTGQVYRGKYVFEKEIERSYVP